MISSVVPDVAGRNASCSPTALAGLGARYVLGGYPAIVVTSIGRISVGSEVAKQIACTGCCIALAVLVRPRSAGPAGLSVRSCKPITTGWPP